MLEIILAIATIIGGLAAIDYFWGKWYAAEIVQWLFKNFRSKQFFLEELEGTVPLNSSFYVERPPIESECYETIVRDGAVIRIKAPRQMGKTSLLTRILYHAKQQGYRTAYVSFQEGDGIRCIQILSADMAAR